MCAARIANVPSGRPRVAARDRGITHRDIRPDSVDLSLEFPSATVPDWSREAVDPWAFQPGRQIIRAIRDYQALCDRDDPFAIVLRRAAIARHRFWSIVAGVEIPLTVKLGG